MLERSPFPGTKFELRKSLTALRENENLPVLCKLGPGTVVTVAAVLEKSSFIVVTCEGSLYRLFPDDFIAHSDLTQKEETLVPPAK